MWFQSFRFIDHYSSCLNTMEIVFTQCDCIRFLTLFFVDLCANFYFSICMYFFYSLFFIYIETSSFPVFGHGFRISLYWRAQVWKVHPFSKNILNYSPPFRCVFQIWMEIVHNPVTQNFLPASGLWYSLLTSYQDVLSAWKFFWLLTLAWLTPFPSLNVNSSVMDTVSSLPLQFPHIIPV